MYDEHEDISYSWVREYNWDVCNLIFVLLHSKAGASTLNAQKIFLTPLQVQGDDASDPTTFLVSFDEGEARYVVYT